MTGGEKMIIGRYVIHVLNQGEIILNDFEGVFNMNIDKFIQKQVKKIMKHELTRKATFTEYEKNIIRNCADSMSDVRRNFLTGSKEIASYFYEVMTSAGEVDSCDLLIASISMKDKEYLAILRLDYKKLHNHKIDYEDNKFNIQMIENEIAIQNTSIKQAALIAVNSLEKEDLYVLDIESEKIGEIGVFTNKFINAEKIEDEAYKTKEFIRLSNIWINNSVPDVIEAEKIREIRNHMLKSNDVMDLEKFSDRALDYEQDEQFTRFCEQYEIDKDFTIDHTVVEKKLNKRTIKTTSGFTISGDLVDFEDKMKFRIERNSGGTCDLIIKNVDYLYQK